MGICTIWRFWKFQAFTDEVAPKINDIGKEDTVNLSAASRIVFSPSDNFGYKKFPCRIGWKVVAVHK